MKSRILVLLALAICGAPAMAQEKSEFRKGMEYEAGRAAARAIIEIGTKMLAERQSRQGVYMVGPLSYSFSRSEATIRIAVAGVRNNTAETTDEITYVQVYAIPTVNYKEGFEVPVASHRIGAIPPYSSVSGFEVTLPRLSPSNKTIPYTIHFLLINPAQVGKGSVVVDAVGFEKAVSF